MTRKRYKKLMMGRFQFPSRVADAKAREAQKTRYSYAFCWKILKMCNHYVNTEELRNG